MGLDMYLTKKTYVGGQYSHRNVSGKVEVKIGEDILNIDINRLASVEENVGYWRKANAIHKWFVDNIQEGKDECQETYVSKEKLLELRDLCQKVLTTRDASLLPPTSGFFFGSTDIDGYYFEELEATIDIIDNLKLVPSNSEQFITEGDIKDPNKHSEFYYQASW